MRKGVTLVEVLVAGMILAIGIGGILLTLPKYEAMVYGNNFTREAHQIIQSNFEFYLNKDAKLVEENLDDVSTGAGSQYIEDSNFESTSYGTIPYHLVISGSRKTMNMAPAEATNNKGETPKYLELTAVLTWSYNGQNESVTLTSYFAYSNLTTVTGTWP